MPLGLDLQTLEPLVVDLRDGPHFLIAGPEGSGKTSLLRAWLFALARRYAADQVRMYLVDFRLASLRPLASLPHVQTGGGYLASADRFADVLASLAEGVSARARDLQAARSASPTDAVFDERAFLARYPRLVLAIDDFDAFTAAVEDDVKYRLDDLLNAGRELGLHLLLAGATADLTPVMQDVILRAARRTPTGFILGTSDYNDVDLLGLRLPGPGYGPTLPAGQGYYGQRGKATRVKVARPDGPRVNDADAVAASHPARS